MYIKIESFPIYQLKLVCKYHGKHSNSNSNKTYKMPKMKFIE